MTHQDVEPGNNPPVPQDPFGGPDGRPPKPEWSTVPGAVERAPVLNPGASPWNGVAVINLYNGQLRVRAGTAFLIAGDVLLTAGHNFDGVWTGASAWMGYDAVSRPDAPRAMLRATPRRHANLDLAVLIVEPRAEAVFDPVSAADSPLTLAGYGYSAQGRPLYRQASGDVLPSVGTDLLYRINTQEADSGAPLFISDAHGPHAHGIHLGGAGAGQPGNRGLRFTPPILHEIDLLIHAARASIR